MTQARKLARALADALRTREITPAVVEGIAAALAAQFPEDEFVPRLARKLLMRHSRRAGRKRDLQQKQRIANAAIWARFNCVGDKDEAAANAARIYRVPEKSVYRAAFERKDADMRARLRRQAP